MVQLIPADTHTPANDNPTMSEIDAYIRETRAAVGGDTAEITQTVREIQSKSGAGALLHPAEEYFVERVADCNQ
jgi:hypothetical protein